MDRPRPDAGAPDPAPAPRSDSGARTPVPTGRDRAGLDLPTGALYAERHRPRYHFSPPENGMNHPGGMVHFQGEYHLLYTSHPGSTAAGARHWGHAVSRDLVRWENLPAALEPDSPGYTFSGSAVVDRENTSGFGRNGEPPLVAILVSHDAGRGAAGATGHETRGIAYSTDRGRSWTRYAGNPGLPNRRGEHDFRDPKVFWHEPSARWIMAVSVTDHVEFWASPDLKSWTHLSDFGAGVGAHGGVWASPDLFPLGVAGTTETKWVLILSLNPGGPQGGSGTQYFVGDFDGETFTLDPTFRDDLRGQEAMWLDWGRDNHAGVTWSDVPVEDGRRIFLGWMSNREYAQDVPTEPWRGATTVPRTLSLHRTSQGYRVFSTPVRELDALALDTVSIPAMSVDGTVPLTGLLGFSPSSSRVVLEFEIPGGTAYGGGTGPEFGVELSNVQGERYRVGYDVASGEFVSDRRAAGEHGFAPVFGQRVHRAPRVGAPGGNRVRLEILLDVASMELFADGGATVMTDTYFPDFPFDRIALYSTDGAVDLDGGTVVDLGGIW